MFFGGNTWYISVHGTKNMIFSSLVKQVFVWLNEIYQISTQKTDTLYFNEDLYSPRKKSLVVSSSVMPGSVAMVTILPFKDTNPCVMFLATKTLYHMSRVEIKIKLPVDREKYETAYRLFVPPHCSCFYISQSTEYRWFCSDRRILPEQKLHLESRLLSELKLITQEIEEMHHR